MTNEERIKEALDIAGDYGQIDGGHHKMWVIDQMIRTLLGDDYEAWVEKYKGEYDEENEEYEYDWDTGIAP